MTLPSFKRARTKADRAARFMPGGIPKHIRCYDNGGTEKPSGTFDQYTIVYTNCGRVGAPDGFYQAASTYPFHPQGFGLHGENGPSQRGPIDRPTSSHLGRRVKYESLPPDVQRFVSQTYREVWKC